ncbi:immune inhibitor A domain-containing protein [Ardenticatena maritima]|nr:immune inhibitor A domain-containing protein [Ardenticatena maritima]
MRKIAYVLFFLAFGLCLLVLSLVTVSIGLTWLANDQATRTPLPTAATASAPTPTPMASPEATPPPAVSPTAELPSGEGHFSPAADMLALVNRPDLPMRDLHDLGIRYGRISPDTPRTVSAPPVERRLGDRETFTVADLLNNTHNRVEAELRAIGEHAYWWVQVGYEVDEAALAASVERFDTRTYPTDRDLFGQEWSPGVDGESRLHIFLGNVPGVGGYYSSADEFVRLINPYSNEKEIFYINLNNRRPGQPGFDEVLAHEYQHMIHWNEDRNEETWVNEGLSELAAARNGFPASRAERQFLLEPDWPLTNWPDQSAKAYGSAYLFMQYVADRFGDDAIRALVAEPFNGMHGLERVLGVPFDEVFGDWAVALLLDDPDGGPYAFPSLNLGGVWQTRTFRRYPATFSDSVAQYGIDYFQFQPESGRTGTLVLTFDGQDEVSLLPATAHSGAFGFWSHRGDDVDTTLTRSFDLRDVESATLEFWAWYDIEKDFDYVYVAVSTNGGATWQALPTAHTVASNPNGNAFGPGFTGTSGDGETPTWVFNRVDLTPFVGQEVLVRFEMVNDDALNANGFWLDDVRVPEIGYATDFEQDEGGWHADGWVRTHNRLKQGFVVRAVLLRENDEDVVSLVLDETNRGQLEVPGFGDDVQAVVLVVAGATPVTTERAEYTLQATFEE